jgi:phosphoribosylaminoimidazole carboxylase PurE protein
VRVLSAHRTPEAACDYARRAGERGLAVLIAGAGGAAHLPGVLAAHTLAPVIGVPIANGPLAGVDALLAIVQMPRGIPVATVGIGRADNAALLAIAMLALGDGELQARLATYRAEITAAAEAADRELQREL